ncbi:hypothetical protein OH77DRAFT_1440553 [Trametes cingulata]|nr:hypothetical protein OH77DRAFT_1440553 [Trametes cingulata]
MGGGHLQPEDISDVSTVYDEAPGFVAFNVYNVKVDISPQITLPERQEMYRLCGLIYFGKFHFTCRVVTGSGEVHLHDGMKTAVLCFSVYTLFESSDAYLSSVGERAISPKDRLPHDKRSRHGGRWRTADHELIVHCSDSLWNTKDGALEVAKTEYHSRVSGGGEFSKYCSKAAGEEEHESFL